MKKTWLIGAAMLCSTLIAFADDPVPVTPGNPVAPGNPVPGSSATPARAGYATPSTQPGPAPISDTQLQVLAEGVTAKQALEWWTNRTNIPLLVDYIALEREGVDPAMKIIVRPQGLDAGKVLAQILKQMSSEQVSMIAQIKGQSIEVLTKSMANKHPVLRIYDVADLVLTIPDYKSAPNVDLASALKGNQTGSGGGGGGTSSNLFKDTDTQNAGSTKISSAQSGEQLVQLIKEMIEPKIWDGTTATVRYFNGKLIVRAPQYVHERIGLAALSMDPDN